MFLVLKLLVFYIWCCDGMRLGVPVISACPVDVSVAGRVAIVLWLSNQKFTNNVSGFFASKKFWQPPWTMLSTIFFFSRTILA